MQDVFEPSAIRFTTHVAIIYYVRQAVQEPRQGYCHRNMGCKSDRLRLSLQQHMHTHLILPKCRLLCEVDYQTRSSVSIFS